MMKTKTIAVLFFFFLFGQLFSQCNVVYVTPTGTAGGAGTKASPLDIVTAFSTASAGTTIKLSTGTYNLSNPLVLNSGDVTIEGGFVAPTWTKTSAAGATVINRTTANPEGTTNAQRLVGIYINNKSNFRFQDITITTAAANLSGESTYGVHLDGCSSYTFARVRVLPGNAAAGLGDANPAVYDSQWDGANGATGSNGLTGGGPQCTCSLSTDNGGTGANGGAAGAGGVNAIPIGGAAGAGASGGRGGNGRPDNSSAAGFAGAAGASASGGAVGGFAGTGGNQDSNGNSTSNVGNGGVGGAGVPGTSGTTIPGSIVASFFVPGTGTNGIAGTGGAGGGGGGGAARDTDGCDAAGGGGSGGGGGGGGGGAGRGAFGGGGSFAFFILNNGPNGNIIQSTATAGTAGAGGSGGRGGVGGNGGTSTMGNGCTNGDSDGNRGGAGGAGGKGGNGGDGGNGPAGLSSNIQLVSGSALASSTINFDLVSQPSISATEVYCTNTDIIYTAASSAAWNFGAGSNPTSPTGTSVTTQYTTTGRRDVSYNGNTYTGFYNIICNSPTAPVLAASATTICPGTSATLSITSGLLNDATSWNWYEGSCGGTAIGTGTSISVTPTGASTTYYVRSEGGCPATGACVSITINWDTNAYTWYLDADNDNYYVGSGVTQCTSPGPGYKLTGLLGANDCDDADNTVWQSNALYIDVDNDNYDAGTATVCYGASVPAGYKLTTLGSDCNDNNASIHPGAVDICGNGIDEDCNGSDLTCPPNVWTGIISTDWHTAGNWSTNAVPAPGDNVVIPNVSPNFFPLISTPVTIGNLTVNMGATVDIAPTSGLVLEDTLTISGDFTLQSDASGTAYLDDFTSGGTVIGNIHVQRFNPGAATGYRQLGTPVSMPSISGVNGFTVSGVPGFVIPLPTCDPNYVAYNSPYGSWMQLVENASAQYACSQSLFQILTSGGMTNGRGYYMAAPGNSTFTFTGAPNTGAVSIGLTHANGSVSNGWNMVSNPYPSPLAWETANIPAGIDAIAKVWVSAGTYMGTFQDVDPNAVGTQAFSVGQAFQVRVSTPNTTPTFDVDNSDRTVSPPTYLFAGNDPMTLHIDIIGNGFADLANVRFIDGATQAMDALFDSPKMLGNANQPMIYSVWAGANYSTNSFAALTDVYTLPLGVKLATASTHTLSFSNIDQFPASAMIYLEDTETGTMQDLRASNTYTFTEAVGVTENRFTLHFYPPVEKVITEADCASNGSVILNEQAPFAWNYELTNDQNTVVSQGVLNTIQQINNLPVGSYTLTLVEPTSGYIAVEAIDITGSVQVSANPQVSVNSVEVGQEVQFMANTQQATAWSWTFGDGNTSSVQNPLHIYNVAGNYTATLVASNADCETVSQITVSSYSTASVNENEGDAGVKIWSDKQQVYIQFVDAWKGNAEFTLFDITGKKIYQQQITNTTNTISIDCGIMAAGTYVAHLRGKDKTVSKKVNLRIN